MSTRPTNSIALILADYVIAARPEDLPEAVRHEGRRSFMNWLGCAIGGSRHDSSSIIVRALGHFSGLPQATALGGTGRYDILLASLLNCTTSSVYGFDDTHAEVIVHPTGPIAAPILALAEQRRISGADFLLALVLGIEIECRLSRAVSIAPAHCDVGWYMTGLTGGVGAAAAVGKLLGLNSQRMVWAMGIAAGEASGFRAMHATMCSGFVPAHAGQTGLRAALLAEQGFTCSEHYLEGPRGFLQLFAEQSHAPALTNELGQRYEVLLNTYKPYPCGIVIHPIVDACLQLKSANDLAIDDIVRVDIKTNPTTITLTDRRHPRDDMEAIVSLYHWTAAVLANGTAGIGEMSDEMISNPAIVQLRDRIDAKADPSMAPDQAEVIVTRKSGPSLTCRVAHCVGSATRPMTDVEIERKFHGQADVILGASRVRAILDDCWRMVDLTDVSVIAKACATADTPPRRSRRAVHGPGAGVAT